MLNQNRYRVLQLCASYYEFGLKTHIHIEYFDLCLKDGENISNLSLVTDLIRCIGRDRQDIW